MVVGIEILTPGVVVINFAVDLIMAEHFSHIALVALLDFLVVLREGKVDVGRMWFGLWSWLGTPFDEVVARWLNRKIY